MHRDTHLLRTSQQLLLQLLAELERPATPARARAVARLEVRVAPLEDELRTHLPTEGDDAFISHDGAILEVLRASVHGGALPNAVRRRAVVRTLQLVERELFALPTGRSGALSSIAAGTVGSVRWFATAHPFLLTCILLLLIIVLLWRQDFLLQTRFGSAQITIRGGPAAIQSDGVDSVGLAPEAPSVVEPEVPTSVIPL